MSGIQKLSNFDIYVTAPIDSRLVATNSTQRNNIVYKYAGLKVYQSDISSFWTWNGTTWSQDPNGIYGGSGSLLNDTYVNFGTISNSIGSQSYIFIQGITTSDNNNYIYNSYFNRHTSTTDWTGVQYINSLVGTGLTVSYVKYNAYDSTSVLHGSIEFGSNNKKLLVISSNASLQLWSPTYSTTLVTNSLTQNVSINIPNDSGVIALTKNTFLQGGNSFSTSAYIGTNDNNTFTIKTNGLSAVSFNTNQTTLFNNAIGVGILSITGSPTFSIITNNLNSVNGMVVGSTKMLNRTSVAIGYGALSSLNQSVMGPSYNNLNITDDSSQIAIGYNALNSYLSPSISVGYWNIAIGQYTLQSLTGSIGGGNQKNIAIGGGVGKNLTFASSAVLIGNNALTSATTSVEHVIIGNNAGQYITYSVGSNTSVIIGSDAGKSVTSGGHVLIGQRTGQNLSGSPKICIGQNSGGTNLINGTSLIAIGANAAFGFTGGYSGLFIGDNVGKALVTGDKSIFIGYGIASSTTNIVGSGNLAIGWNSAFVNAMTNSNGDFTGNYNTLIGNWDGGTSSSFNIGLHSLTGSNNVVLSDGQGKIKLYLNSTQIIENGGLVGYGGYTISANSGSLILGTYSGSGAYQSNLWVKSGNNWIPVAGAYCSDGIGYSSVGGYSSTQSTTGGYYPISYNIISNTVFLSGVVKVVMPGSGSSFILLTLPSNISPSATASLNITPPFSLTGNCLIGPSGNITFSPSGSPSGTYYFYMDGVNYRLS